MATRCFALYRNSGSAVFPRRASANRCGMVGSDGVTVGVLDAACIPHCSIRCCSAGVTFGEVDGSLTLGISVGASDNPTRLSPDRSLV